MLKVREGMPKDSGRGIARMDPEDMARLGFSEGQIIDIEGKAVTPARLLSCDSDMGEGGAKGFLQMDGVLRDNAQVGIDDRITIRFDEAVRGASSFVLDGPQRIAIDIDGARPGGPS